MVEDDSPAVYPDDMELRACRAVPGRKARWNQRRSKMFACTSACTFLSDFTLLQFGAFHPALGRGVGPRSSSRHAKHPQSTSSVSQGKPPTTNRVQYKVTVVVGLHHLHQYSSRGVRCLRATLCACMGLLDRDWANRELPPAG